MSHMHLDSMRKGYIGLVNHCRTGRLVTVKGQQTREHRNVLITIRDPWDALPIGQGRKISTQVAAAEFLQLVAGVQMPNLMIKLAPFFRNVLDGEVFHGGYGQRLREALPLAVERLQLDPETRQAQVVLWDNLRDLYEPAAKDIPCTSSIQFFIRGGRLEMDVTMRSNDVWLGIPYDAFVFGQLQCTVANYLGLEVGDYAHHARSLHLYERDVLAAGALHYQDVDGDTLPRGLNTGGCTCWADVQWRALSYLTGETEDLTWWTRTLLPL